MSLHKGISGNAFFLPEASQGPSLSPLNAWLWAGALLSRGAAGQGQPWAFLPERGWGMQFTKHTEIKGASSVAPASVIGSGAGSQIAFPVREADVSGWLVMVLLFAGCIFLSVGSARSARELQFLSNPLSHPSGHLFLQPLPHQSCFFLSDVFLSQMISSLFQASEPPRDQLIRR